MLKSRFATEETNHNNKNKIHKPSFIKPTTTTTTTKKDPKATNYFK